MSKEKEMFLRLERNIAELKRIFGGSADLNIARFKAGGVKCALATLEGMVSSKDLANMLFSPIMDHIRMYAKPQEVFCFLCGEGLFSAEQKAVYSLKEAADKLCAGFALVLVDGVCGVAAISAQGYEKRSLSEPETESNIKGTHEALSDNLRTSMSLLRRRMKDPRLRFELCEAGALSKTELCVVYIEGRTPQKLIEKTKRRLKSIKLPMVLTSGSLIPFVADNKGSFFCGASTTERPDVILSKLNEGRIAVLIDGVPYAVICPAIFTENFQAVDDYEEKPAFVCYQRLIRYFCFFISAFFPGTYVACAAFHPEVLSRPLLLSLIASEENTPYPLVTEMFIAIVMFEILKEAGLRLPKVVGGAVSIVGGLVIGDAAVTSGLISAPLLIIIGITATSSFVLPSLNAQTTLLRIAGVAVGSLLGFFGMGILITVTLVNACTKESFGVPYTAPISPFTAGAMRDVLVREDFKDMQKRDMLVEDFRGVSESDAVSSKGE